MADVCKMLSDWKKMQPDERLSALKEIINYELAAMGYAPVEVKPYSDPDSGGSWDYEQNTVYDEEDSTLRCDDAEKALDAALHEESS